MICLTRLNGEAFALNPDLIERVEAHPDTVVTLTDDVRFLVRESVHDVLRAIRDYRADVLATAYAMDRGAYPVLELTPRPTATADHSVLAFPIRQER
ncbi:flagellar FlbD family protein [Modestobacter sp. Leaf380]|uniref:flagellar FlbD family protein n=1 Tax=Modestobacter sp. Leaf380 TaxID=1736356 RepID=UPI00070141C5|nr:flagellar FlbD family protein [Modestobacter sp. Leaf380]KQS68394.1 flagellar protein FlbD [Modestobacter sp. Leaf380]